MASKIAREVRVAVLGLPLFAAGLAVGAEPTTELEEVTVTAQRREESLQTAPIAVTAIDATALERRQVLDTKQIVFNVPNLTGNSNVGQTTATTFFIRGVGTTENLATADTSVGLYLDDVYVARQAVNNFNLLDIERVEVLRGPQGTLYGRNSNGGAIKIVTKKPSADPEFKAAATVGNYNRWELKLSGNGPVSDTVFVRGNFLTQNADGYIRNLTLNKDVNDTDYIGGRVAVRILPSETFTADLAIDYGRDKTNGGYASDIGNRARPRTTSLLTVLSGVDNRGDAETLGASLKLSWQLSDSLSLDSISGYRTTDQDLVLDLSDQPSSLYTLLQKQSNDQLTQEFQLNGTIGERVRYVAGLYYFTESTDVDINDLTRTVAGGAQTRFTKKFTVDSDSYAGFGQIEYQVGALTFIAGARYTSDDRKLAIVQTSSIPGTRANFDTAALIARGAAGQDIAVDRSFSKVTPKAGVNWAINDDLFGYLSYTKGFRSGGWAGRSLFVEQYVNVNPENVESYELGAKATLADRRIRWNNSLFVMDYTDLFNSLQIAGVFTVQTGDARIKGVESEFTFRATSWLDLFANIGYLDTEYTGTRPANLAPELQRSPKTQIKVGFSVDYPLAGGSLLVNGDVFNTDDYRVSPANLAVTAPLLPATATITKGFSLVNASVGYRWNEDRFEVAASCTNCLNEEYFDAGSYIGSFAAVYAGAPRFYRLTGSIRF